MIFTDAIFIAFYIMLKKWAYTFLIRKIVYLISWKSILCLDDDTV